MKVFIAVISLLTVASQARAYDAADCFQSAYNQSSIKSVDQAVALCQGAVSDAPIKCYAEVYSLSQIKTADQAVSLCRGAVSLAPVECFKKAYSLAAIKTADQAISLCASR